MVLNKKIVLGILILIFLVIIIVPVCGQSDFGSEEVLQKDFNFYAEYDRLVDTDSHKIRIYHAALSGDGTKLAFSGENIDNGNLVLYTVNADGSDLTLIPIPSELQGIEDLVINEDGSLAFFRNRLFHLIYKVEDGALTQILDTNDYPEINAVWKIQTTADGEYVYFMEDRDDLWRLGHSSGTPELIIEDTEVSRVDSKGNKAWAIKNFAISNDANTIAFILSGYYDSTNYYGQSLKHELFVSHMGKYKQLTNDAGDVSKEYMDISGDGTVIAFSSSESPQAKWYSIHSDGSSRIAVENAGFNVGGVSLTYDGTKMFYGDALANGGRLVNTDGSGGLDLLPASDVNNIVLAATWDPCISDDGSRVSFRFGYSSWPFKEALYVGYLNDPGAVPDAPIIDSITFNPPSMPMDDPDATVILTSKISDPQGLVDIERTSTDELVNGRLEIFSNLPVYISIAVHDDGNGVDGTAGDGIYSTDGKPGGKIDELDRMTVRIGAMDSSKTVVVADTVLPIGGALIDTEKTEEISGLIFESRSKSSGSTVLIPLTLNDNKEQIGNMDITLGYDPSVLEATEVIKGGLTADSLVEYNLIDYGTIKISLGDNQGFYGDGSIAYVRFNVIGAEGGVCRSR